LILMVVLGAVTAEPGAAQSPDVSGSWHLSVTTDRGVTRPSVTLEQDGAELRGHYVSDALGEHEVSGSIEGSRVTWSLTASVQDRPVPVVYEGTLADDGSISGTIDIGGGILTGTFTATRSGG
jgi:hypothetical protein